MNSIEKITNGSITSPKGFTASAVSCGLKSNNALDLGLIYSEKDAVTTASFTSNTVTAAPVKLSRNKLLKNIYSRAIVINSGYANACTGKTGEENAEKMTQITADELNLNSDQVLIASTGKIGVQLPMDKISNGIKNAVESLSKQNGYKTAQAIMTTDTVPKEIAYRFKAGDTYITIAGIAKGSGMIAPELTIPHATMLCFITTDAVVSHNFLQNTFQSAIDSSFNRITVDGDMSTNDSVFIMANGKAENKLIDGSCQGSQVFAAVLNKVMVYLAKEIVMDGEGATKLVKIIVKNAATEQDARSCVSAIANSLLCKTAWFGCDPNWGRILCAAGYSDAKFDPGSTDIFYNEMQVVQNGQGCNAEEKILIKIMKERQFSITVDLKAGKYSYHMWTNDISHDYVKINAYYHT